MMTPDQIFSIVNLIALAGWVLLAVLPGRPRVTGVITAAVIPAIFAAIYVVVLGLHWGDTDGGFGSLSQVATLFTSRWALLAGWTHYLAFDLLVGSWEARDARARGIPHGLVLPCLFLTFMFGPAGWLLYMTVRAIRKDVQTGTIPGTMPKLVVLYPPPTDVATFERRYRDEHAPMVHEKIPGLKKFVAALVLGAPAGAAPYHRVAELYFDSMEALQAAAVSAGGQVTVAHAVEISTGGAPVVMIAEDD